MGQGVTTPKVNKRAKSIKKTLSPWIVRSGNVDVVFLLLVLVVLVIGVMMMFSASYAYSFEMNGDSLWYFKRQAFFAVLGIGVMFVASKIDVNMYRKFALPIMGISFALLILVLIHPDTSNGKTEFKRWLKIGITFQPSEIAKLALIIFMAWLILKYADKIRKRPLVWIFLLMIPVGLTCLLVMAENHLSGTILILCIGIAMSYMAGTSKKAYIAVFAVIFIVATIIIINREALKNAGILPSYIYERLQGWLDPNYDPQGSRWQTNQSLYAIGSGGFFGLGIGNSRQKYLYLPEPQNDFVFAIVCEELGFFRSLAIIILFVLLVLRGISIARHAKTNYEMLVTTGIVFQVGLQVAINIGVVTGILPNTGISFPFFSYGGTSLVLLLFEMGMVLSASRQSKVKKLI